MFHVLRVFRAQPLIWCRSSNPSNPFGDVTIHEGTSSALSPSGRARPGSPSGYFAPRSQTAPSYYGVPYMGSLNTGVPIYRRPIYLTKWGPLYGVP